MDRDQDLISQHLACCFRPYDEETVRDLLVMTLPEARSIGAGTREAWEVIRAQADDALEHHWKQAAWRDARRVQKNTRQREKRTATKRAAWIKEAMELSVL